MISSCGHQFEVPRSDWFTRVLAPMRQADFLYLEVAVPSGEYGDQWQAALDLLRRAEEAWSAGDDVSVFTHLRGALDALPGAKQNIFDAVTKICHRGIGSVGSARKPAAMTVPLFWPREGQLGQQAITALRDVLNKAMNVPVPPADDVVSYVQWVTDSIGALQPWFGSADRDYLIRTPTYWAALSLPAGTEQGRRTVSEEMRGRRRELEQVVGSLEAFAQRFADSRPTTYVVPDTNVLLEHPGGLSGVDWCTALDRYRRPFDDVRVVIPLAVVDELDDLKRVHRTEKQARTALRMIYRLFGASLDSRPLLHGEDVDDGLVQAELLMEPRAHQRLPRIDDELIRVASRLSSFTQRAPVFMTYDTGAAFRAAAAGSPNVRLRHTADRAD